MKLNNTTAAILVGFMGGIAVTILTARFIYDIQTVCQNLG